MSANDGLGPIRREMTVGDLIARLLELPQHYPVAPFVNRTAGVMLDAWAGVDPETSRSPLVFVGEPSSLRSLPTVPAAWVDGVEPLQ